MKKVTQRSERMTVELYDELKTAFRRPAHWRRSRPGSTWWTEMSEYEFDPDIGDR